MNLTTSPDYRIFNINGINHISPTDAFRAIQNGQAYLIDVREPEETMYETVRMANVIQFPISGIIENVVKIPTGRMLITACPAGVRSLKVAKLLIRLGFENVVNLGGGLNTWKSMGLPVYVNRLHKTTPEPQQGGSGIQKPWSKPSETMLHPNFKEKELDHQNLPPTLPEAIRL